MCAIDRPSPFLRRHFMFFFLRFRGSLKGCLMPWQSDYWRSGCHPLGGVFSRLLCALGFPFYLGPLSPVYLLAAAQGLAAYSCFTTQSFWYSLKDLFAQLSASTSSLVVSLYCEFEYFYSTPLPSVLENWVFSLSFGTGFKVWQCLRCSLGRI